MRILAIFLLCLASTRVGADDGLTLTVTVTGLTPNQGQVVVSLFDSDKNYMKKPLLIGREKVPDDDSVNVAFPNLKRGTYAASVYYDLDSDGELDTGLFRIPSEPVGFSNNARGKFGPAKWKKTNFQLTDNSNMTIQVTNAVK